MSWNLALTRLEKILVDSCQDTARALRIAEEAGISPGKIASGGAPIETWHQVLKEADTHKKVDALVQKATEEYPERKKELDNILQEYQTLTEEKKKPLRPPGKPKPGLKVQASNKEPSKETSKEIEKPGEGIDQQQPVLTVVLPQNNKPGCLFWWRSQNILIKVALIGLFGVILAPLINGIFTLAAPLVREWANTRFNPTATIFIAQVTSIPTTWATPTYYPPTLTETPAPTNTPTIPPPPPPAACLNAQVSYFELILQPGSLQQKDFNEKGVIALSPLEVAGLGNFNGNPAFSDATVKTTCTCQWQAQINANPEFLPVKGDCSGFLISDLQDPISRIILQLNISGWTGPKKFIFQVQ